MRAEQSTFPLVELSTIVDIDVGKTPARKESSYWGGENTWVSISDLNCGRYIEDTKEGITDEGIVKSRIKIVPENTILFSFKLSIGKVAITKRPMYTNEAIAAFPIKDLKQVNQNYLYYVLKEFNFTDGGERAVMGKTLNKAKLKELKIPLPPLEDQKKIADILDSADSLLQKDQQLVEHYDRLSQSLFLDMFGDPIINQKNWDIKNLVEITDFITDGKHGDCRNEENSGYYFISAKDIRNGIIDYSKARQITKSDFEEVHRRTDLKDGNLVMVNTGATIGKMAIASSSEKTEKTTFQKSVAIIKPNNDILSSIFLKYVFKLRINDFASKGSGSAIKNLLLSEMRRFKIILPNIVLQNQFADYIAEIEKQKDLAKQNLKKSEDLFNSLLQRAFKGELTDS